MHGSLIILIGLLLATDIGWWVWADRHVRVMRPSLLWRALLGVFMGLQLAGLIYFLIPRVGLDQAALPGQWTVMAGVFIWHLLFVPALLVLLVGGGATWLVMRWTRRWVKQEPPAPVADEIAPAQGITRRQFTGAVLAGLPPLLAVGAVGRSAWEADEFRIRRIRLVIPSLPAALEGLSIAHVSDIHVGDFTHGKMLKRIVEATNLLRADLVLVTGDLINRSLSDLPAAIDVVRQLDPHHALAMCEGNHDLFESRLLFDQGVKQSGIDLLVDESRVVWIRGQKVQLLGMQWGPARSGGVSVMAGSMARLNRMRQGDAFPILLAHHPHAFDYAAQSEIPLTLSGHTHGGQLMLSKNIGFGPMMYRYWSGHYRQGDAHLVVSNGVGNWFPLRVNAPAEIIHLSLHRT